MSAPIALWRQLRAAAFVLQGVRAGQSWTSLQYEIEPALRPGVQAIAYAALRRLGLAIELREQLATKAPAPFVDALLCTTLALLSAQDEPERASQEAVRYDAHTLVSQAVQACKSPDASKSQQAASGFVNACLRRFLRERESLLARAMRQPKARHNHPAWWVAQLERDWGAQAAGILAADAQAAPLMLRISEQKQALAHMECELSAMNLGAKKLSDHGWTLPHGVQIAELPGYDEGYFVVQDAAAQLAAPLLLAPWAEHRPSGSLRVLDACAAPGGKTAHLLDYAAARDLAVEVTALEIDERRAQRIRSNLDRLKLKARIQVADAAEVGRWYDGQPFDAILLDAPCSASGIVRRHPDILWLRRQSDIAQLVAQQRRLLLALWPLLKPGGRLLYVTCSVFKAEGQEQMEWFMQSSAGRNTEVIPESAPGHLHPSSEQALHPITDNQSGAHDGFFYALLRKA